MSNTNSTGQIIGLHKALIDPETEAPVTHFIVSQYTVRLAGVQDTQVVVQGYTSVSAWRNGKRALAHMSIGLVGHPTGDTIQWLYEAIAALEVGDLSGSVLVHDEVPATAESGA